MSEKLYTKEQEIIVERILKHKAHEYYKILDIEKSSNDVEIKKAYRKVSLKVHPDKNKHPKSDESFKRVAKAFEVLGDSSKRRIYDQTGSDPDSRGGFDPSAASSSGFNGFGGHQNGHPFFNAGGPFAFSNGGGAQPFQFQQGDLFDILFGNSGSFGGTTFTFGGNGGGFQQFGGFNGFQQFNQPRSRGPGGRNPRSRSQQQEEQADPTLIDTLKQYLPLVLMILVPIISSVFSDSTEKFQFHKRTPFVVEKTTSNFNIPYYITEKQVKSLNKYKSTKLDKEVETTYISTVRDNCRRESNFKDHQINEAYGWFFTDEEKLQQANSIRLPNCERLQELGVGLLS